MKDLSKLRKEHDEACNKITELLAELEKMKKEGKDRTETNEQLGIWLDKNMKLKIAINSILHKN